MADNTQTSVTEKGNVNHYPGYPDLVVGQRVRFISGQDDEPIGTISGRTDLSLIIHWDDEHFDSVVTFDRFRMLEIA